MSTDPTDDKAVIAAANIAIVERFFAALNTWDFDTIRSITNENDFVFTLPYRPENFPGFVEGRENWLKVVSDWSALVDGSENLANFVIEPLYSDPGQVITFYTSEMLMKTGARYDNSYVARFVIRDGLVVRWDEYNDAILMLVAIGGTAIMPSES
jgi:ketosteroid isomerase-like protein